uniref:Cytochrome c oxidase subunit 3 n=1 Tax=Longidorus vineacola TaxID=241698 RepID=A0A1P8C755_9BILA|nr:cytochrome c oxidase subunit III [Longidorus vineacola]AOT84233.1 cytochrome c oxidase subunit III [Longidorus vineacola]
MMAWQLSHVLDNSWVPIIMSLCSFSTMAGLLLWFKFSSLYSGLFILTMSSTIITAFTWFRDISREGSFQGHHTWVVMKGLKWGLVWFLFSEVWFFFSVFWSFFHASVAPITSGFISWPFISMEIIPPFQVPLLNTLILLMSGVTATLAHQALLGGELTPWVKISIFLGIYFLALQGLEYYTASYTLSAGAYGSVFFFGTGFHGLHVCLGVMMLTVSHMRHLKLTISSNHHFSVEFSLWYWHFVDVVWLFLFFWVYTWGG